MLAFESLIARVEARLERADTPSPSEPGVTHAAVTLLLRRAAALAGDRWGAEILFIKRAEREGDPWSGHLALPGGRWEPGDPSVLGVAIRETAEEVGIDLERGGRILGRLEMIRPLSTRLPPIAVTPYVALAPPGSVPRPQPGEVEAAFWMSLERLSGLGACAVVRRVIKDETREWRAYPSPWGPIWGITERIVSAFIERAR